MPSIPIQNEESNREFIENLIQNLETKDYLSAQAACAFLLRRLRPLLVPDYSNQIKTSSRSAQPPRFGAEAFGFERVKNTLSSLETAIYSLEAGQHVEALQAAKEALETWNMRTP